MSRATFVCWHCGEARSLEVELQPTFGFEVAALAKYVDFVAYHDFHRGRVLLFCDKAHADAERTKAGYFRRSPKGIPKTEVA